MSPRDAFHKIWLKFPFHFWEHLGEPHCPQMPKTKQPQDRLENHLQCRGPEDKGPNFRFQCLNQISPWKEPKAKYQTDHSLRQQVKLISNFPPIMERSGRARLTSCYAPVHGRTNQALRIFPSMAEPELSFLFRIRFSVT